MSKPGKCFLFISTLEHLPWGGCEDLWYKTALWALENNQPVFVIVFRHPEVPQHLQVLSAKGARLHYLQRPGSQPLAKRALKKIASFEPYKKTLRSLENALGAYREVTVLISQAGGFDFAYGYLDVLKDWLLNMQFPYGIVVQNVADLGCTLTTTGRQQQNEIYDKASSVGFVARRNWLSSERILAKAVPHAYLLNNPLNFDKDPGYVSYPGDKVARLAVVAALRCFHKGQDVLLQVLAGEEWKQRKWQLSLYGKGPDEAYLRELVRFYKLEDKVFFKGHVQDIKEVWEQNHIHILPSLGEGTPLALIESMWCGRTAVTTDVGGNAEYVSNGENGFVAVYPTFPALQRIMEEAWQKKMQWEDMGKKARREVVDGYDTNAEKKLYKKMEE